MIIQYEKDFKFWKKLYKSDEARYKQVKMNIANAILTEIVKKYPQYEGKIEVIDTWTPYTYARRNNDTNGAYMRFITTAFSRKANMSSEIKGIDNVFLASHCLKYPGGLPMAAVCGKGVIDIIKEKEKPLIPFVGDIPIVGGITEKISNVIDKKA